MIKQFSGIYENMHLSLNQLKNKYGQFAERNMYTIHII